MSYESVSEYVMKFLSANAKNSVSKWEKSSEEFQALFNTKSKATKEKRKKKEKDENAPKKNKSSYMIFCAEERAKIKSEMPDLSSKDILRELGKRWGDIKDDEQKMAYYKSKAEEDKERYTKEKGGSAPAKEEVVAEEALVEEAPVEEKPKKKAEKKVVKKKN